MTKRLMFRTGLSAALTIVAAGASWRGVSAEAQDSAAGIRAVRVEGQRATIEAKLDPSTGLRVFVGEGKLFWTWFVNKQTNLTATVEGSAQIRLQDGSLGRGFVFRSPGGGTHYVAITEGGAVPYGELEFRENARISAKDGIFTFADIRRADGTRVPISVRVWKGQPAPASLVIQAPGSMVAAQQMVTGTPEGGSNLLFWTNAPMKSWLGRTFPPVGGGKR